MLTLHATSNGYCGKCGEPSQVGRLRVKGWKHELTVCAKCTREIAAEIERQTPNGSEER